MEKNKIYEKKWRKEFPERRINNWGETITQGRREYYEYEFLRVQPEQDTKKPDDKKSFEPGVQ